VVKLTSAGAYQWHTFYGQPSYDYGFGIAVDASGNVYITGYSNATWGNPLHAYSGYSDIVVVKLTSAGAYQWHTFYGSSDTDIGYGIAVDANSNVYITGYSGATWQGDGGAAPLHAHSGYSDIVVVKLTSAGAYQWHTFYGSSDTDIGSGIAVDANSNVYITGDSYATWQGDGGVAPLHAHSGSQDIVALKLTSAGAYQWHTFYGSSNYDEGRGIAVDASSNVYVTGQSYATWQGDGGAAPRHAHSGSYDIAVLVLGTGLSKTVTPATAGPRAPVTYTLRLDNPTAATLTSIVLTDTLPTEILYPQVSSTGVITARAGTRYVWDVAPLPPGASALITITGQVSAAAAQPQIVNTARFSSSGDSGEASATLTLPGVSVRRSGGGVGAVTSAPAGIACGKACDRVFATGTLVTLTAAPAAGSVFCGWSGACSGTGSCALTVSALHSVGARFGLGDCSSDVTISAVRSGDWANPATWSAGRVPDANDVVAIGAPYAITAPATPIRVAKLYQQGTLQSARGSALTLAVTDVLSNTGTIRGQDGVPTAGATCGGSGSDVRLSSGTLRNVGTIQGGAGRGGGCCGGDGGKVALSFEVVDNTGQVRGGAGGNVGCCATSTPGQGGSVAILSRDRAAGLKSSGDFIGGKGGDQATGCGNQNGGCGGDITLAAQPMRIARAAGQLLARVLGGQAGLDADGKRGNCGGEDPVIIRYDPSDLEISGAELAADGIVIFGGTNWTLALTNTVTGAISATNGITLAVGTGGSIDLRGCQDGAFTADRFFIASDNVLLDAGKTLTDVVDAAVIEQVGARILGDIAVSAPGYVRGARGEALDIPIELVNNSPVTFTYALAATGGSGLPASVAIGPVGSAVVTLTVNAPALGGEAVITVTATAQASPFHSGQAVIRVYAPPVAGESRLAQTFQAGVTYPFAGTLGCGGITFAADWTGVLTATLGAVPPPGALFLPRAYTITVSSATPAVTLTLCYDEGEVEDAGFYSDSPLSVYKSSAAPQGLGRIRLNGGAGTALPGGREASESAVIGAGGLPGVFYLGESPLDYGDLPDAPYATLKASDGARHAIVSGSPYLGAFAPTAETEGQPTTDADKDGAEDGVTIAAGKNQTGIKWSNGAVSAGGGGAVQVVISGADACLGAHFDFDGTGTLYATPLHDSAGEVAQPLSVGTHTLYFDVPAGTFPGAGMNVPIYARFRVTSPVGGNCAGSAAYSAEGLAADGEVEDYAWSFTPTAITLRGFAARGAALPALGLLALGAVALALVKRRRG
jgi:uncharacterized repeat protein (TIGR01451 family)